MIQIVGININAILRGISLFIVSYVLFVVQAPIFSGIDNAAVQMNINLTFINTMHTLGNYFCALLGFASILYVVFAGLFVEPVTYQQ